MIPHSSMDLVTFVPEATIRSHVEAAFTFHRDEISTLLPYVEIHHVGSTAVPGSLTKGDLDIQIRVPESEFAPADAVLASHCSRNVASTHSATFASFKDDEADPPLGIQLTTIGGPEDFFVVLRDHLIAHAEVNERYNELKRQFEGAPMDQYRAAKAVFMEALLEQIRGGGG